MGILQILQFPSCFQVSQTKFPTFLPSFEEKSFPPVFEFTMIYQKFLMLCALTVCALSAHSGPGWDSPRRKPSVAYPGRLTLNPEPEGVPQKPASPRPSAPQKPASPKAQNSTDLPPYYPPGWEERIDASSGRKYCVNLKTDSISWKNPNLEPAKKKPASIKKPVSKPSSSAWLSKIGSYDDDDDSRQPLKRYNSG